MNITLLALLGEGWTWVVLAALLGLLVYAIIWFFSDK